MDEVAIGGGATGTRPFRMATVGVSRWATTGGDKHFDVKAARRRIEQDIARMASELAGENPTPLERLLCERVAICHTEICYLDWRVADPDGTVAVAEYHQRRRDRAHRRFISACKALDQVRRIRPAVVVNVHQAAEEKADRPWTLEDFMGGRPLAARPPA